MFSQNFAEFGTAGNIGDKYGVFGSSSGGHSMYMISP